MASYVIKIRTGVLPVLVDDIHGRLRDGDTISVTGEEVEELVSFLTRISGGKTPKKCVKSQRKRS
jgi:hypothetical protein